MNNTYFNTLYSNNEAINYIGSWKTIDMYEKCVSIKY